MIYMSKEEEKEFKKLVAWNNDLKLRLEAHDNQRKHLKQEIKLLKKAIRELEKKYDPKN